MTGEQTSLLAPTASEERAQETDTAERCDDPTPRGVIRAALAEAVKLNRSDCDDFNLLELGGCRALREWFGHSDPDFPNATTADNLKAVRVLDVGAGYGAWSSEMRRLAQRQGWPVHITGVELKAEREWHMRKWCDEVLLCDWRRASEMHVAYSMDPASDAYDIAIGNPPFDELTGPKGAKRPPEECMPAVLLRHAPAALLLHTTTAFQKSEAGRASWRHNQPAATWLVPGGVGFRGPGGGNASDCYQVTLWLRDHSGPCSTYLLDDLDAKARQWVVPPGTEEPTPCPPCAGSGEAGNAAWLEWSDGGMVGLVPTFCTDCKGSGLDPHGDLPAAPGWQP